MSKNACITLLVTDNRLLVRRLQKKDKYVNVNVMKKVIMMLRFRMLMFKALLKQEESSSKKVNNTRPSIIHHLQVPAVFTSLEYIGLVF